MREKLCLGALYAVAIFGLLTAEEFRVTVAECNVVKEPNPFSEPVTTLKFGDTVSTTGDAKDGYVPVKGGWIAQEDIIEPGDFKAEGGGGDSAVAKEGAYVKGFDPEVEKKYRTDNPDLDSIYNLDVNPMVWATTFGRELEPVEMQLETLQLQGQGNTPEADRLRSEIARLDAARKPELKKWEQELAQFRKDGKIGEFAGRK